MPAEQVLPDDARGPRKLASDATRRRLLDAGRVSFGTNGYSKTAVQQLLSEASVTPPVLYYHFGNKLGLFVAVADEVYQEFLKSIHAAVDPIDDFDAAFDALLSAAGAAYIQSPTIASMAFTVQIEVRRYPELAEALQPTLRTFRDLLEQTARKAPQPILDTVGVDGLVRGLASVINGLLSIAVTLGRADDILPAIESLKILLARHEFGTRT